MTDYTSSEFLTTPQGSDAYEDLDWHNKIKIKALEGLDQLAANLNAIANIKAIEFQINHLNSMTTGFTDQLNEKDAEIAHLQSQLNAIDHANQEEIAQLRETVNKFRSVLTSIDTMTDEVIS